MSDNAEVAEMQDGDQYLEAPAVRVLVMNEPAEQNKAAEFGAFTTYALLGTERAFQLLPRDPHRSRAVIQVANGLLDDNNLGFVRVGTVAQCQGTFNTNGGLLVSGVQIEFKSQQELWCVPDGIHSLTVTVLDERYR